MDHLLGLLAASLRRPQDPLDLAEAYGRYGLQSDGHTYTSAAVRSHLERELTSVLDKYDLNKLRALVSTIARALIWTWIAKNPEDRGAEAEQLQILDLFLQHTKDQVGTPGKLPRMRCVHRVIELVCEVSRFGFGTPFEPDKPAFSFQSEYWTVSGTRHLAQVLPQLRVRHGRFVREDDARSAAADRLVELIAAYPAASFIGRATLAYMNDIENDGFLKAISPQETYTRKYLYSLAWLALKRRSQGIARPSEEQIWKIALALTALDGQPPNMWSYFHMGTVDESLLWLQKVMSHTARYHYAQSSVEGTLFLLDHMLHDDDKAPWRGCKAQLLAGLRQILVVRPDAAPLTWEAVKQAFDTAPSEVPQALIRPSFAEENVRFPQDLFNSNVHRYPLRPLRKGVFAPPVPPLDARAAVEALLTWRHDWSANHANVLGARFEEAVRAVLARSGVQVHSGKFVWRRELFDADSVAVVGNTVVIIEAKSKSFTREALGGAVDRALLDLGASFWRPCVQAYRIEAAWRNANILQLYPQDATKERILGGDAQSLVDLPLPDDPRFARFVVTSDDFGIAHNTGVVRNLLLMAARYEFGSTNPHVKARLDQQVNRYLKQAKAIMTELLPYYGRPDSDEAFHKLTFHTRFMTFSLLFELARLTPEGSSPLTSLINSVFRQAGDHDFVSEVRFARTLQSDREAQ